MTTPYSEVRRCPECGFPQQEWRRRRGRRLHLSTCSCSPTNKCRVYKSALGRIVNGAVEEPTDRDEDGVAQGGFVRQMTRSEMIDVAWAALQKVRGASDE